MIPWAGAAALVLAVAGAFFGAALTTAVPLPLLRIIVGTFLLTFGLQWLRKAILRYAGLIAYYDEERTFEREVEAPRGSAAPTGAPNWTAFVIASRGNSWRGWRLSSS